MINKIVKTILFASIFISQLSSFSFAMDNEFEVDIGKQTLKSLREIPEENFHKPRIKLTNVTSDRKFFDDADCYAQSIAHKLLNAMVNGRIERIEYSYSKEKKSRDPIYMVHDFMDCVAKGQKIAVIREKDGTRTFELRSNYEVYKRISPLQHAPIYREFIEFDRRIIVVGNGELHFYTRKWQEEEETNNRLRELAIREAEERRRERAEERLETMSGGACGLAKGYDPYFDE